MSSSGARRSCSRASTSWAERRRAIGASFFQEEIARSAYEYQLRVESGDAVIVGVNKFADGQAPPVISTPDYSALERDQVERVRAVRRERDAARVDAALAALREAQPDVCRG